MKVMLWLTHRRRAFIVLAVGMSIMSCGMTAASDSEDSLAKARALFAERCKTAGEKIHRTVDGVESVFVLKVRPEKFNFDNQFELDDPYGRDFGGDDFLKSFLRGFFPKVKRPTPLTFVHVGYRSVEAVQPTGGKRYRYTGEMRDYEATSSILMGGTGQKFTTRAFMLDAVPALGKPPRYGITYDDISTREDREHWIAGSSLKVVDLQTREVIAERVGYLMDPGHGHRSSGRSPWLLAANHACPAFRGQHAATDQLGQTSRFVEQVLKPKGE